MGYALKLMHVGEAVSNLYLAAFSVMALLIPLLGEKVSALRWASFAMAFTGTFLIIRLGAGKNHWGWHLPLGMHFVPYVSNYSFAILGELSPHCRL